MTQFQTVSRNVRPCRRRQRILQRAREELEVNARLILRPALTVLLLRKAEDPFRVLADLIERGIGSGVSAAEELGKFSFDGPKLSERSREYLSRHRIVESLEALLREVVRSEPENVREFMVLRLQKQSERERPRRSSDKGVPRSTTLPVKKLALTAVRGAMSTDFFRDALKNKRKSLRKTESFPPKRPKIETKSETLEERRAHMKMLLKRTREWFASVGEACKEHLPRLFPRFQVQIDQRLGQGRFADVFRATCVYPMNSGDLPGESVALKRFRFAGPALPVSAVGEIKKEIQAACVIFGSEKASLDDMGRFIRLLAVIRDDDSGARLIGTPTSPRSKICEVAEMKKEISKGLEKSSVLRHQPGDTCPCSLGLLYEWGTEGDLHQRLHSDKRKALSGAERLGVIKELMLGLRFLHSQGYAHGDIKSHNVILFKEDDEKVRAKIGDLGSVIMVPSASTHEGLGTLGWTAPEAMATTTTILTSAIDIFSLGVLAWDCATAPRQADESLDPFISVGPREYVDKLEQGVRPSFRETDQPEISMLRMIAETCWATNPDERPSADALVRQHFDEANKQ